MCRYMRIFNDYKTHWACIPCRWTAQHPVDSNPRCPTCRAAMVNMGHDFQPPRRGATNQWRKLALLDSVGIRFHSCGCTGPGWRPRTLADAKRFLAGAGKRVGPGRVGYRRGEWEDRDRARL